MKKQIFRLLATLLICVTFPPVAARSPLAMVNDAVNLVTPYLTKLTQSLRSPRLKKFISGTKQQPVKLVSPEVELAPIESKTVNAPSVAPAQLTRQERVNAMQRPVQPTEQEIIAAELAELMQSEKAKTRELKQLEQPQTVQTEPIYTLTDFENQLTQKFDIDPGFATIQILNFRKFFSLKKHTLKEDVLLQAITKSNENDAYVFKLLIVNVTDLQTLNQAQNALMALQAQSSTPWIVLVFNDTEQNFLQRDIQINFLENWIYVPNFLECTYITLDQRQSLPSQNTTHDDLEWRKTGFTTISHAIHELAQLRKGSNFDLFSWQ